ncbi:MAG: LPS export ABC transporter periplasmic protein LptC, partial [Bacteroidota bacterium]
NKLFLFFYSTGIIFLITSMISCSDDEAINALEIDEKTPLMTYLDVSTLYSQNSTVRLKIEAPLQYQFKNRDEVYPKGVYVEFFDSLGVKTTTLEADSGYHKALDDSYSVHGNVVVVNIEEGQQLNTEVLYWDKNTKEIFTDSITPVKITTQTEVINGNGLRAQQDFSEFQITGGVTGIFTMQE